MIRRAFACRALVALATVLISASAWAQAGPPSGEPVVIGEINSYSAIPAFTEPYRKGWQLALEQVNEAGGVLGRPLEVISRDDGGRPADAITAANELVIRQGADVLMGTFLSNVGLAVSDFAARRGVFFLAAEPLSDAITLQQGNAYTFRLRPSTGMQARMLAEEAAKLPATRWASVAPNYEYGQSAVAEFKAALAELRPDVEWVGEQWPPLGKLDAGPVVQALVSAEPEAVLNVTFGPDLVKFVREGRGRGLFEGREVASFLTGEPEYLEPFGAEAPEGWIVTGYPWYGLDTPDHQAFLDAYRERFGEHPYMGSVVGYAAMQAMAVIIEQAGGTEAQAMIDAARGVEVDTPFGPVTFRAADHQATMGTFVGRTAVQDGQGVMVEFGYRDGADYTIPEDEAAALRPSR